MYCSLSCAGQPQLAQPQTSRVRDQNVSVPGPDELPPDQGPDVVQLTLATLDETTESNVFPMPTTDMFTLSLNDPDSRLFDLLFKPIKTINSRTEIVFLISSNLTSTVESLLKINSHLTLLPIKNS